MQQTIDVTGLSPVAVQAVQVLVASLRGDEDQVRQAMKAHWPGPPPGETAEEWIKRFHAWCESRPRIAGIADDSRESIYDRSCE